MDISLGATGYHPDEGAYAVYALLPARSFGQSAAAQVPYCIGSSELEGEAAGKF